MKYLISIALLVMLLSAVEVYALTPITFIETKPVETHMETQKGETLQVQPAESEIHLTTSVQPSQDQIIEKIRKNIDVEKYREVKVQPIHLKHGNPSYYILYMHSKTSHRVDVIKMTISDNPEKVTTEKNYKLQNEDFMQQPGPNINSAICPDNSIEFIAFAPNDDQKEQDVTIDVATSAAAKLKTINLLKEQATRRNYLNYLTCPRLRGNFYDGDANPQLIMTADGSISADDIKTILQKKFQLRVTNIWLACEAYNDPMLTAVVDIAQTRKYAAGINDLSVGPSDDAAACTMKAAIAGQLMKASFDSCYQKYDTPDDHWGFGGNGTDKFWDEANP